MFKHPKRITGIYLGQPAIDVVSISRGKGSLWQVEKSTSFHPDGSKSISEQVRLFLSKLKRDRGRRITLAVPRDRIFFRELEFPHLTSDEAVSAVRMGIELHAHLKKDEIYYDVREILPIDTSGNSMDASRSVRLLIAYVERSFLEPVLKAVSETGHRRSLGCISPLSCGIDGLLRNGGEGIFPCTVLSRQEDEIVISLHSSRGWEGSHSVSLFSSAGIEHRLQDMARLYPEPFRQLIKAPAFRIGEFHLPELPEQPEDPCGTIKALAEMCGETGMSMGLCAAGIGLKSFPEISFQDAPRKKPFRIRINFFQIIVIAIAAVVLAVSGMGISRTLKLSAEADDLKEKITGLEKRLAPFVEMSNRLEDLQGKQKALSDFTRETPDILNVLRDIATLTPEDTWIRNFSLSKGKIRISAEGKSATACVSSLRKSPQFSQVKLVSSVTKTKNNKERFSLEIISRTAGGGGK